VRNEVPAGLPVCLSGRPTYLETARPALPIPCFHRLIPQSPDELSVCLSDCLSVCLQTVLFLSGNICCILNIVSSHQFTLVFVGVKLGVTEWKNID